MDSIRAQIVADALLQAEISRGLIAIADSLPRGSDLRVVRILARILETSWIEHVDFQHQVAFPILMRRHRSELTDAVKRSRSEHARLSRQHRDVGSLLESLLSMRADDTTALEALLRETCALRQAHFDGDAELDHWLAEPFSAVEITLCTIWETQRPALRFPLNLLNIRRRALRIAGRLH